MTTLQTTHVRIEGRVQGVAYRAWTEGHAIELGIAGWVRNRRDGSVEAVFQGPSDKVREMLRRCESGPPAANVSRVEILGEDEDGTYDGFVMRPTV